MAVEAIVKSKEALPMLRFIAETMLRGIEGPILRRAIEAKGFPRRLIEQYQEALSKLIKDPLIKARMLIDSSLYEKCADMREFLRQGEMKVAYVLGKIDCQERSCYNRGYCMHARAKLITNRSQTNPDDIDNAIDELHSKNLITASQADEYKQMEQRSRLSGLSAAQNSPCPRRSVPTTGIRPARDQDAFTMSAENFVNRESAVRWAAQQISAGTPVLRIRQALGKKGWKEISGSLVDTAIRQVTKIRADVLDDCTQKKYLFAADTVLVRAEKCTSCSFGDQLYCNQQRVVFSTGTIQPMDDADESPETREIREIREFYAGSNMRIDIKPKTRRKNSEIRLDNPGSDMIVDLGKSVSVEKENLPKLFAGSGAMTVEIKDPLVTGKPMDIEIQGAGDTLLNAIL